MDVDGGACSPEFLASEYLRKPGVNLLPFPDSLQFIGLFGQFGDINL
jgi:hypothetical protein